VNTFEKYPQEVEKSEQKPYRLHRNQFGPGKYKRTIFLWLLFCSVVVTSKFSFKPRVKLKEYGSYESRSLF
jgi:hypothetical protein